MKKVFKQLKENNPNQTIHHITAEEFEKYGKILNGFDWKEWNEIMRDKDIPHDTNQYIASDPELEKAKLTQRIAATLYAGMEVQVGYCNGPNSHLNGLEYHKGSEINIAVTDLVLILGHTGDIHKNQYRTEKLDIFYLPEGTMIEIYQTTLHFAPCKVHKEGFKCMVILPKGTNEPIDFNKTVTMEEDELLFMKNKWLLAHPDRKPLISKGAYPGIIGENLKIEAI
ncbi:DUF4867 family protein [Oceanobacillus sp. CFH 90083]|uniref:DUF4867 family protein n=1 Tax=Oceanobacillus sp. CFH 90083 TaxID=2592336 RepID=UPI00128D9EB4|nr:DUF4867 family protein [Oceanobacillus sp. CFH 90083]